MIEQNNSQQGIRFLKKVSEGLIEKIAHRQYRPMFKIQLVPFGKKNVGNAIYIRRQGGQF
jgi:hypothetical protein